MKTGSERERRRKKNQRGYREKMRKPQVSNQIKSKPRKEKKERQRGMAIREEARNEALREEEES